MYLLFWNQYGNFTLTATSYCLVGKTEFYPTSDEACRNTVQLRYGYINTSSGASFWALHESIYVEMLDKKLFARSYALADRLHHRSNLVNHPFCDKSITFLTRYLALTMKFAISTICRQLTLQTATLGELQNNKHSRNI